MFGITERGVIVVAMRIEHVCLSDVEYCIIKRTKVFSTNYHWQGHAEPLVTETEVSQFQHNIEKLRATCSTAYMNMHTELRAG